MQPEVRLVEEGSGDVVGHLPLSSPSLAQGDEILWASNGDTRTYKIEKVQYCAEQTEINNPDDGTRYAVYGRTDYIVSEV